MSQSRCNKTYFTRGPLLQAKHCWHSVRRARARSLRAACRLSLTACAWRPAMARDVQALAAALGEAFAASSVPESLRAELRLHLAAAESVRCGMLSSSFPVRHGVCFFALPSTECVCWDVETVSLNHIKVCQDVAQGRSACPEGGTRPRWQARGKGGQQCPGRDILPAAPGHVGGPVPHASRCIGLRPRRARRDTGAAGPGPGRPARPRL